MSARTGVTLHERCFLIVVVLPCITERRSVGMLLIASATCTLGKNFPAADCYRMRRAQNRRSQFPQRYCLIDTNLNNLSSKSRRRDRLIRSLLQSGHVITRKCLYSLIGRSKYPNSAYVVPSDETSIRACINPQILSLRRIAPGWEWQSSCAGAIHLCRWRMSRSASAILHAR